MFASLALGNDGPNVGEATMSDIDKWWIVHIVLSVRILKKIVKTKQSETKTICIYYQALFCSPGAVWEMMEPNLL